MTFDEKIAIKNYKELDNNIMSELISLDLDKNKTEIEIDEKFERNQNIYQTKLTSLDESDYKFEDDSPNNGENPQCLNSSENGDSDNSNSTENFENTDNTNHINNTSNLDKIKFARDIQAKCGFVKLKSPNTHFGVDLFVSVRQVNILKSNGIDASPGNFLIAHSTGFFLNNK